MNISDSLIAAGIIILMLLPSIIAFCSNHPHKLWIFILNIVLGRGIIGWIICLIWSLVRVKQK